MANGKKLSDLVLEDIADCAMRVFQVAGFAPDRASQAGSQVADAVGQHFGGAIVYFPNNTARKARERAAAVVAEFTGTNHNALAIKHGIGVHNVYKILAADLKKRKASNGLPPAPWRPSKGEQGS